MNSRYSRPGSDASRAAAASLSRNTRLFGWKSTVGSSEATTVPARRVA
jgi:hypothetical protein